MPESPSIQSVSTSSSTAVLQRSPSKLVGAFSRSVGGSKGPDAEAEVTKTTEYKQALLARYLPNVDALVEDLRESAPFGGTVC